MFNPGNLNGELSAPSLMIPESLITLDYNKENFIKISAMRFLIRRISAALLFGLLGCNEGDKDKSVPILQDHEFSKVKLTDLRYKPIDLNQYGGKTIFLNFWATWCRPCLEEMSTIDRAQNILRDRDVIFLLASIEPAELIKEFKLNHNYKFNYVRIENSEALNIQGLPTTFIFNPSGRLVFSEMGYRKWDDKNNIDMILKIIK